MAQLVLSPTKPAMLMPLSALKAMTLPSPAFTPPICPAGCVARSDAAVSVAQRGAVNVGPDLVALDHYACRSAAHKNSIGTRVDYIAGARRAATDRNVE